VGLLTFLAWLILPCNLAYNILSPMARACPHAILGNLPLYYTLSLACEQALAIGGYQRRRAAGLLQVARRVLEQGLVQVTTKRSVSVLLR
jgi:hypothetical protein